jgi:hypothetical protein
MWAHNFSAIIDLGKFQNCVNHMHDMNDFAGTVEHRSIHQFAVMSYARLRRYQKRSPLPLVFGKGGVCFRCPAIGTASTN